MKPDFKLPLTGRCQCRSVAYKIAAAPLAVYACHCTECQRQSGSAFSLSLLADRSAVAVEEGQPAVWERQHESGDAWAHWRILPKSCSHFSRNLF